MISEQEIIINKNLRQLIIKDKIIYKKTRHNMTRPINEGTTRRNDQKNVKK